MKNTNDIPNFPDELVHLLKQIELMQRIPQEQKIVQLWVKTHLELRHLQAATLICITHKACKDVLTALVYPT